MSIRNKISEYVKSNGLNVMDGVFGFIFNELNHSLNIIKIISFIYVSASFGIFSLLYHNGLIMTDKMDLTVLIYVVFNIVLTIALITRYLTLKQYSFIVVGFYNDFEAAMRSRVNLETKQYKAVYILTALIKTLSEEAHTSKFTVFAILVGHNKRELKTILR